MAGQVVIIIGAPGAGKTVQAGYLEKNYTHLSSGEILRSSHDAVIKAQMEAGELVSSNQVEKLIEQRLEGIYQQQPILLDGFPRTLAEATWLMGALRNLGRAVNRVIFLNVPRDESLNRLSRRGRLDDRPAIELERWDEFDEQTMPLIEFYRGKQLLREVDGVGTEGEVAARIEAAL